MIRRALKFTVIVYLALIMPHLAAADIVRITHGIFSFSKFNYEIDLKNTTEKASLDQWQVTVDRRNNNAWMPNKGSGFVIYVSEAFSTPYNYHLSETQDPIPNLYPNGTRFKAVYILTNHHVWNNDKKSNLQSRIRREKVEPGVSRIVLTKINIYDSERSYKRFENIYMNNTYLNSRYESSQVNFVIEQKSEKFGLKLIDECVSHEGTYEFDENITATNYVGCDYALVRILVPEHIGIKAMKICQENCLGINELTHIPRLGDHLGSSINKGKQIIKQVAKDSEGNSKIILTQQDGHTFVPRSGWSGSPLRKTSDNSVTGLVFSGATFKGSNRIDRVLSFNINHILNHYDIWGQINKDFEQTSQSSYPPFKPNFWSKEVGKRPL